MTIGIQLAITILIFVYGGYRLDLHYNRSPLFVSIGAALGMVIGFYNLMKELSAENIRSEREKKDEENKSRKKVKWM